MTLTQQGRLLSTLATVASHVLETAAFAFAEIATDEHELTYASGHAATLIMTGDLNAVLTIAASESLCLLLSADVIGCEPEDMSSQQASDMLGELANIIAGQLATDLLGENAIVHLAPPRTDSLSAVGWGSLRASTSHVVLVVGEDEPLLLDLQLQELLGSPSIDSPEGE